MIDLTYYLDKTNKTIQELQILYNKAKIIAIEDLGEEQENYIKEILNNMLNINENKILDLQKKFLESDKSFKEFMEDVYSGKITEDPQISTSLGHVSDSKDQIIPPNDKKDKEFEKSLNEIKLPPGVSLKNTYIKELSNMQATHSKQEMLNYLNTNSIFLDPYEYNEIVSQFKLREDTLSVGKKVEYNGNKYEVIGFEDGKVRIKNSDGEEKIVIKRAFESKVKETFYGRELDDLAISLKNNGYDKNSIITYLIRNKNISIPDAEILYSNLFENIQKQTEDAEIPSEKDNKAEEMIQKLEDEPTEDKQEEAIDGNVVAKSDVPYYDNKEPQESNANVEEPIKENKLKEDFKPEIGMKVNFIPEIGDEKEGFIISQDRSNGEYFGIQDKLGKLYNVWVGKIFKFRESKMNENYIQDFGGIIHICDKNGKFEVNDERTQEVNKFDTEEQAIDYAYFDAIKKGYIQESKKSINTSSLNEVVLTEEQIAAEAIKNIKKDRKSWI
jgi:hypothetical protein